MLVVLPQVPNWANIHRVVIIDSISKFCNQFADLSNVLIPLETEFVG